MTNANYEPDSEFVDYRVEDRIAVITMKRPERLNAWGSAMGRGLTRAFEQYKIDREARVAILCGEGRAFCAGADAKEFAARKVSWSSRPRNEMGSFGRGTLFKPVIGAIQGNCLGAGLLLLAVRCDIRVAAEDALFGLPEVKVGIVNCEVAWANQGLPTAVLMEMSMVGDPIDAKRAFEIGLVNKVVPNDQLMKAAFDFAHKIAKNSPQAVRMSKENLLKAVEVSQHAKDYEFELYDISSNSPDALEGFTAHVDRREPAWTDE